MSEIELFEAKVMQQIPEEITSVETVRKKAWYLGAIPLFVALQSASLPMLDVFASLPQDFNGWATISFYSVAMGAISYNFGWFFNASFTEEVLGRELTKKEAISSLPFLSKFIKTDVVTPLDTGNYHIVEISGRTSMKEVVVKPKDPIDSWDNLFELETGEKIESRLSSLPDEHK